MSNASHFRRETANENEQFIETITLISKTHFIKKKAFKGTVVNRALPSEHERLL